MNEVKDLNHRWVTLLKRGNQDAAKQLYSAYSQAMYNTLIRITGNKEDAKDLLQDSFVKAFSSIEQLQSEEAFGGWLKRIVVNKAVEFVRKQHIEFVDVPESLTDQSALSIDEGLSFDQINQKVSDLPNGCREVFTLYLIEGYSHKEIAGLLSISESTSKSQYHRARQLLKESLSATIHD